MKKLFFRQASVSLLFILLGGINLASLGAQTSDDLAAGFASPPDSARPTCIWHWMSDNISKEGITADMEDMKQRGIGGVLLVYAYLGVPQGTVKMQSDDWFGMVQFAAQEAHRLGLTMELAPEEGWSAAGGTWIKPDHSMLRVTTSEIQVTGPAHITDLVPQPPSLMKFYRDISVLAFPTPPANAVKMTQFTPSITSSDPAFDGSKITDGNSKTTSVLPLPSAASPQYVQFEFAQPYEIRSFSIQAGAPGIYAAGGELKSSSDGQKFSILSKFKADGGTNLQNWAVKTTSAKIYRIVFDKAPISPTGGPAPANLNLAEISLQPGLVIDNLAAKTDVFRLDTQLPPPPAEAGDLSSLATDPSKVIDITKQMAADGHLSWDAPAGNWTIIRLGYTTTGKGNSPATPDNRGLESDKLSSEATDMAWNGLTQKILDHVGPLKGQTVTASWVDSWEAGSQNWTPAFQDEFKKRRGYDMLPYLPVFAGHVVGTPEQTDRFLWDLRRTIADLLADNFFSHMAQLAHQQNMKLSTEPYGSGPFEDLQVARDADIVRGEFWPSASMLYQNSPKLAVSIAHTYGKKVVGMESFTDFEGKWQNSPEKLKPFGDLIYTLGANHFTLHEYAHTPWINVVPGMTLGQFGTNFNRSVTWAKQSSEWMHYIARCDYLLQQGLGVADFLCFNGERVPNGVPASGDMGRRAGPMAVPAGYDYDDCSEDVILTRLSVKDGRLVLPDGKSYRALILPDSETMTPGLVHKLKELVDGGATIFGAKPSQSPSLSNYPQCDDDVKKTADELWDGKKITDHPTMLEIIPLLNLKPDFEFQDKAARLLYTHRNADGTDLYFVSNQNGEYEDTDCIFRVHGKVPELWHPDTGKTEPAPVYTDDGSRITIPLHFEPSGSVFVVFRDPGANAPTDHPVALTHPDAPSPATPPTLQITKATYGSVAPNLGSEDATDAVTALVRNGGLSMMVDPNLFGRDPTNHKDKQLEVDYVYNGTPGSVTVRERDRLTIGSATPKVQFPDARLRVQPDKSLTLEAWQPGTYSIKTAAGKEVKVTAPKLPDPITLTGPWDLSFPPKWGAPDKITLDQLASWSDNSADGVKYFSGTATYDKTVSISAEMLGPNHHLYLDLGDVKVIAEVTLNGKDVGILWKDPFCIEITDVAKSGDNALEIKVTNLWPNRIIGDEKLPHNFEWFGSIIKAWPDWLIQGKPDPSGRFTFEPYHQYNVGDPLLPSGLLGPVSLIPSLETKAGE